eukprot:g2456.t1
MVLESIMKHIPGILPIPQVLCPWHNPVSNPASPSSFPSSSSPSIFPIPKLLLVLLVLLYDTHLPPSRFPVHEVAWISVCPCAQKAPSSSARRSNEGFRPPPTGHPFLETVLCGETPGGRWDGRAELFV